MDKTQSANSLLERISSFRATAKSLHREETSLAVACIRHAYAHGDATPAAKLVDGLEEVGTKNAAKAFKYLCIKASGISLKGSEPSVDDKRANEHRETYQATLEMVEEMTLRDWYDTQTGKKSEKTDEEKAKAKAKRAENQAKEWLKEQSMGTGPEAFAARSAYQYMEAMTKLYKKSPGQAEAMLQADIAQIQKAVSATLSRNIDSLRETDDQAA